MRRAKLQRYTSISSCSHLDELDYGEMVRKKETIQRLTQSARNRRLLHNSFRPSAGIYVEQSVENNIFFQSVLDPNYKEKTKKKRKRVKVVNEAVSEIELSSDEENAGGYIEPENQTANDSKLQKLKEQQDSDDDFSLEIWQGDRRVRIVDFHKGIVAPHEPKEKLKAKIVPKSDKAAIKKPDVIKAPKFSNIGHQKFVDSIILDRTVRESKELNKSFRVFDGVARTKTNKIEAPTIEEKRISFLNYTPVRREVRNVRLSTMPSTSFVFEPDTNFVSTPIERKHFSKCSSELAPMCELNEISNCFDEMDELHTAREPTCDTGEEKRTERTKTPRPADDSLTEILENDENWSRKRSKTVVGVLQSTLQQETVQYSTMGQNTEVQTMMDNADDLSSIVFRTEKVENKENLGVPGPQRKRTIQPQEKQMLKESRLSVMTTASSRRESINSLMEEISLDDLDLNSLLGAENRTVAMSDGTMSRAQTAMTVHLDDVSVLPFYLADVSKNCEMSPMEQLLHVVGQEMPMKWSQFPKGTFTASNVRKLGEGAYGEVFATKYNGDSVAIKIVPIEPDPLNPLFDGLFNGAVMPSSSLVLPEVVVMKELTSLNDMTSMNSSPNFIKIAACHVVRGKYPAGLIKAWDAYAKRKESLNDRPTDYSSDQQTFITFITANGGTDLESFVVSSENEIRSILCQLLLSLVVAEKELEFEHRDMHLGNVLIATIEKSEKLCYKYKDNEMRVNSFGVKANIIDFTLSRIKKEATTVFLNLENDEEIFKGQHDEQFDVYRRMRVNNDRDWQQFHPCTNLWWVEYLANRMIEEPICPKKVLTAKRRKELKELFNRLGQFASCSDTFLDVDFFESFYAGFVEFSN